MTYTINPNDAFKSIEITFDGKPSEAVRDALKALRFRWHSVKKVWYGYATPEIATKAIENATKGVKVTKTAKTAEKVNKYGVKVGDVFYLNWGWEQTNVDFFQVCELVGETSVRVKHVNPRIIRTENEGFMCGDYTYDITPEPMAVDTCTVFVKDSEHGDVKRITDKFGAPSINFDKRYNAHKIPFGERKEYVSWYA